MDGWMDPSIPDSTYYKSTASGANKNEHTEALLSEYEPLLLVQCMERQRVPRFWRFPPLRSKGHNPVHACQRCWLHLSLNKADHKSTPVFDFALKDLPQVVYVDVLVSLS